MIAHGFLAALTFGLSGYIDGRRARWKWKELGGLLRKLPFIGTALIMAAFAGCGLPGFANFAGEVTVFFGAWKSCSRGYGAGLLGRADDRRRLYAARRARDLHAPLPEKWMDVADAPHIWRKLPFALLLTALLVFGFFPRILTDRISPSAASIVQMANPVLANARTSGADVVKIENK